MDFTTEETEKLSDILAEIVLSRLDEAKVNIGDIEEFTRKGLKKVGKEGLGKALSKAEESPEKEIQGKEGEVFTYHSKRDAKIESVFGWVTYNRSYYTGDGRGKAPLDEKLDLAPGQVTSGLAKLLATAGVNLPFEESARMLKEFLLFEVSDNTVRKETQSFGRLQQEIEESQKECSTNLNHFRERKRKTQNPPKRVYGSIDGAHVPIQDPDEEEKWREMKVGSWYNVEEVPPSQQTKRHQKKEEIGHQALRAKNKLYYCDIEEASKYGELFWATGYDKKADLAQELVFVNDGAQWIWKLVEMHYPNAKQILDWFHAEERLEKVAEEVFSEETKRNEWLESTRESLWRGRTQFVIHACEELADDFDIAKQAKTYFENNKSRMKYDLYRDQGYMIASGTVESACKQIVSHRLRCAGAQWKVQGAKLTGKARSAWLSGEEHWGKLCQKRASLPLAV